FQVPAMMLPGLTLVITPLISLMKDQVDGLRARRVPAAAVHSGLSRAEHRLAMDRASLGKIKLLYLSPEKLQSPSFTDRLSQINVSLIVVDEAHCISQWGYDFRPSYLKIASLRRAFPDVPVLALTASATPEVTADIMAQLQFRAPNVFARSFTRPNISYVVRRCDSKPEMLLRVLRATAGCAIVYVRSRRRTREIADMLCAAGIPAEYYHAGLAAEDKNDRQNRWKNDEVRVMVATNAFGMGIDKPDVRTVVHVDLPSSLEEYYQEAGRAGRDGLHSYAVIITAPGPDKASLTRRLNEAFPEKDTIRRVYELACNFLEVAVGSGYNQLYEFNFALFCDRFRLPPNIVRNSLLLLSRAGYIDFVDEVATRSRVIVVMNKRELYDLQLDAVTDSVFQLLLRTYTGLFSDYVIISEELIASRLQLSAQQVYEALLKLAREHAIHYVPRRSTPYIFFTTSRELPKHIALPRPVYEDQRRRMEHRVEAMRRFVFDDSECRVNTMLRYFGEQPTQPCGTCDVCRSRRRPAASDDSRMRDVILYLAGHTPPPTIDHIARQAGVSPARVIAQLRTLLDEGVVTVTADGVVRLS
ncbi:MAG: RecQ family ATP-dependent DNA helicase, partial [Paramuribaculum sp.]